MEYRIMEKEAFSIVGKVITANCENGDNLQQIPMFWAQCANDGTLDKLDSIGTNDLLGVCLDMQPGKGSFTYMIAAEADLPTPPKGFAKREIPASTWAIFTSTGPLPGTIQKTFGRVFQEWFPATGYEHSGAPELEVYPPGDTTAEDYRCEVWIPIVKK